MKKIKLWKRIAGWLLVFLLILQLPVNVFAEEWTDNILYASEENFTDEQEVSEENDSSDLQTDIEAETDSDSEDQINLAEEDSEENTVEIEESDPDSDVDVDEDGTGEVTGEDEFTDGGTALFSDGTDQSEEDTAKEEIQVTVSISKDGKFLNDKDGNPMAGRTVTLAGQSSYTMDDALKAAHDLYYPGGAEAGYDFHEDGTGNFDGLIYKLWGYDRSSVPGIRYARNNDCKNYQESLTQSVVDGDSLNFYIEQRKNQDRLAFFTETEETITQDEHAELHLRQSNVNGTAFSECSGASIYIDGVKQDGLITDESGKVTLPSLEARDTPYFITAEKLVETSDGSMATAISAAYINITVVSATGQTGDYIDRVNLKVTDGDTQKAYQMDNPDGESAFTLPSELSHGKIYLSVDGKESIPENCSIYAVYTNPSDETVCRVKLQEGSFTFLKNTSVKYSYKAIRSVKLEVRQNGNVIQTVQIPISYKAHLSELTVKDSWSHEIDCKLQNNLDDQQFEISVPQNTEYIDIGGWTSGWGYLSENPDLISIEGVELTNTGMGTLRFTPDWKQYSEYKVYITLPENDEKYIFEATKYTLIITSGDADYTPVLSYQGQEPGRYGVMQGDEAESFVIQPAVIRADEGKLSYQWYQGDTIEKFDKIDGATTASYQIPTGEPHYYNYYKCIVSYEIDGKIYTAESEIYRVRVYPLTIEAPQIIKQPVDISGVKGVPLEEKLSVELSDIKQPDVKAKYQWYKNTEENTTNGLAIPGATDSSYEPDIQEAGNTYYYCRIRYQLQTNTNKQNKTINSEFVYSDAACVTVTEAPLPWEGKGTESSPYLIKTTSDIEALRDKVNTEGFSFEDMYFQLTEDVTLPDGWKPIGVTKDGKKDLQNGANLNVFSGIFDGNNHTVTIPEGGLPLFGYVRNTRIRNLNIYGTKIAGYGLVNNFEGVGLSGTAVEIDNVTLKSGSSTLKAGLLGANKTMSAYAGCSAVFEATVRNCTIEKDVVIGYDKDVKEIGAIAGRMQGTVENCVSYATVYGTSYVGGIIGTRDNALGNCSVIDCKFYGTVEASGELAGGIVGGGYDDSSAPNGRKVTINSCVSEGTVTGSDKVGGILGGDLYVAQSWQNCIYTFKNNSFTGKVQATGQNTSYVGGIIGFYDSLNRIDDITNNYYAKDCGAEKGIGFVRYIDTSCTAHETASGTTYISTETEATTAACPEVEGCGWQTGYNRTDDPLGADSEKLFSTEGLNAYVDSLELSGDYRKEFYLGDELDLTGMIVKAKMSDGTTREIDLKDLEISGFDNTVKGEQTLSLKYEDVTAYVTVKVLAAPDSDPIYVSFTLLGDSRHGAGTEECHTLDGDNLTVWVETGMIEVGANATVYQVMKSLEEKYGFTVYDRETQYGTYIDAIEYQGVKLSEFDNGENSGWMDTVNDVHPNVGVAKQYLNDGDVIVFHYTDDYTQEDKLPVAVKTTRRALKNLPDTASLTLDNKSAVEAARKAYDALTDEQKAMISEELVKKLEAAETRMKELHSWDAGRVTKAATCKETGEKLYTCTECGKTKTEVIPKTNDHKYTWKVVSKATVFAPEKQQGTCSVCGTVVNKDNGSKLTATIKLNASSIKLQKKQTTKKIKVTMANGDSVKSWTSSNKKIATVDKNGVIKAGKKTGTARITVTLKSGKKATLKVKVQKAKVKTTKISGLKKNVTLKKGQKLALKPVISPLTSQEKVTYTSSNKKVATVSKNGTITAKKKGTVKITVRSGKKSYVVKVKVK